MTRLDQMRYYRSSVVLGRIAKHLGLDNDQAHEWMKKEVFKRSTRLFTDDEFDEKMRETRKRFSREGVWIPKPGEEDMPPPDPQDYQEETFIG